MLTMRDMKLTAKQLMGAPLEMLDAMALGLDSHAYIAPQYGYSESELDALAEHPTIKVHLARRAAELAETGYTRKYVNSNRLQVLEHRLYEKATQDDITHAQLLEVTKYYRDTVEPKNAPVQSNGGSGFQINIILKDRNGNKTTIHAEAPHEQEATDVVEGEVISAFSGAPEGEAFDALPEVPAFLADKRVTANSDLSESV